LPTIESLNENNYKAKNYATIKQNEKFFAIVSYDRRNSNGSNYGRQKQFAN